MRQQSTKLSSSHSVFISPPPTLSPSDFICAIIHELKNPLNAILGFSELLKLEVRDPKSAEDCADYAREIGEAAVELNELIHDLLDVGAANSGNFSVDLSQGIDVRNVIKRSVKLNYDYAMGRRISLKVEIAEDVSFIRLDAKRMKQILANLISNAIKYSPQKTEVKISVKNLVENNKKYLQILIADQGFGMSEAQVQTAFVKYKTIQNPNSGSVDSFGLGLPITKQLVELQNGIIEVKSELNRGTEMKLRFPYSM